MKIILKPTEVIEGLLYDLYDIDTETTVRGTEFEVYSECLNTAPRELELYSIEEEAKTGTFTPYVIVPSEADYAIPVSFAWVEGIEHEGTIYKLEDLKNISKARRIKTDKPYTYITVPDLEVIFDDSCCTRCGSTTDINPTHKLCDGCISEIMQVKSYQFKPTPAFKGTGPIYYGLELEYAFKSRKGAEKVVLPHYDDIYLKHDSSIEGPSSSFRAELVSHPHSFEELMNADSFINKLSDSNVVASSNHGCHIHISRKAFKDKKHYALFYFLMYSSKEFLEYIGKRPLNRYCKFIQQGEIFSKENAPVNHERSAAINENNSETVEVRIFNSTANPEQIKSYIQFLDSLIHYTGTGRMKKSLLEYIEYVDKNKERYPELHNVISTFDMSLLTTSAPVVYRKPIEKNLPVSKLTLDLIPLISEITLINGSVYKLEKSRDIVYHFGEKTISFRARKCNSDGTYDSLQDKAVPLAEITTFKVLK